MKNLIIASILFSLCLSLHANSDNNSYQLQVPQGSTMPYMQTGGNQNCYSGNNSRSTFYTENSMQVGNTTYHNGYSSNGAITTGTTQQIGNSSYTNMFTTGGNDN